MKHMLLMIAFLGLFCSTTQALDIQLPFELKPGQPPEAVEIQANFKALQQTILELENRFQQKIDEQNREIAILRQQVQTKVQKIDELEAKVYALRTVLKDITSAMVRRSVQDIEQEMEANRLKERITIVVKGIRFEVEECTLSEDSLTCSMQITSTDEDRRFTIFRSTEKSDFQTRIIDSSGNEYTPTLMQLGDREGEDYVGTPLFTGVSIDASVHFENIPTDMETIALLELACDDYDSTGKFPVRLQNIPLTK